MTAYTTLNGNVSDIESLPGCEITAKAKTNSKFTQKITIKSADQSVGLEFMGSGEKNTIIGQSSFQGATKLVVTFEYADTASSWKPSKLNSGGPYAIGNYNLLVLVAENGDDSDFNDSILEFSWNTPKG